MNVIRTRRSYVPGAVPTSDMVAEGQLAINIADKLFFTADPEGNIISLGGAGRTIIFSGDVAGSGSSSVNLVLAESGVTDGTYTKVTVDIKGRVTVGGDLASGDVTTALGFTPYNSTNPSAFISANQSITVSGDATGSGTTALALTLAASGVSAGTYTKVTVDAKGRVTVGAALNSSDVTTALGFTPVNANGTLPLNNGSITSASLVTSTTAANQSVDSFSAALYRAAKYVIQVTSGAAYHFTEINVLHDGTTASISEFSTMFTGVSLATFDCAISGGNLTLQVTPTNAVTTIKVVRTSISV